MHQFHKLIFGMKLYLFRTVSMSIIRSSFTAHSAMVYVIQVCRQLSSRTRMEVPSWFCSKAVWHIPLLRVPWINSWWWAEELSETRRVSCQNKFVKLTHLVGLIIKKFVTMHGHMNVKFTSFSSLRLTKIMERNLSLWRTWKKNKKKKHKQGNSVRHYIIYAVGGNVKFTDLSCPMLCPLVLLVNIDWGPGVTVGYEEGKVMERGLMMSQRKLLLD